MNQKHESLDNIPWEIVETHNKFLSYKLEYKNIVIRVDQTKKNIWRWRIRFKGGNYMFSGREETVKKAMTAMANKLSNYSSHFLSLSIKAHAYK